MSNRNFIASRYPVSQEHGIPPKSFLDELIDSINPLPDVVFERNDKHDIYSVMLGSLGPYTDLLHRKAVMCEVLRVMAAFESDWNWNAGVDKNNEYSKLHKQGEETGAFQVSWDSLVFDKSLTDCLDRLAGAHDVDTFISKMKQNHSLAVEYCARLLRFNTTWCGTINHASMVISHVRRDSVQEFKSFLTLNTKADINNKEGNDISRIDALIKIASDSVRFNDVQKRAAKKLLDYDGEIYPHDGCAITLSILLQDAGVIVPDIYQAIELTNELKEKRKWKKIPVGQQEAGDIGTTCGDVALHGADHIYLVLKRLNDDEMVVADNQAKDPHSRWASGEGGKTPTKYFLRAV
jgi:hypothetical protein